MLTPSIPASWAGRIQASACKALPEEQSPLSQCPAGNSCGRTADGGQNEVGGRSHKPPSTTGDLALQLPGRPVRIAGQQLELARGRAAARHQLIRMRQSTSVDALISQHPGLDQMPTPNIFHVGAYPQEWIAAWSPGTCHVL